MPKNWCFWTVVLEKTLESPLDCKEIHPVHPKGNQSWILIGRTDAEAEAPILRPSDMKNWLIWIDLVARKDCRWKEKGMTENEMVGWHYWLDGHEFKLWELVMDREVWHTAVHRVAKSRTRLSELNWADCTLLIKSNKSYFTWFISGYSSLYSVQTSWKSELKKKKSQLLHTVSKATQDCCSPSFYLCLFSGAQGKGALLLKEPSWLGLC